MLAGLELTNVRGEIETRQGRLNFLVNKTAFSTITVNLALKTVPEAASANGSASEGWQLDKAIDQSWDASLKLLGGIITVVVQLLVFSWWYLPFVIAGLIILWHVKRVKPEDRSSTRERFQG